MMSFYLFHDANLKAKWKENVKDFFLFLYVVIKYFFPSFSLHNEGCEKHEFFELYVKEDHAHSSFETHAIVWILQTR